MKKLLTVTLLTVLSVVSALAQNGAKEQELIRLQQEWRAAIERGDRDALNRFIADDFSNRIGASKAEQIENSLKTKERQADQDIKNLTNTPFDYTVKFKGADVAVMRFKVVDRGQYKGQEFTNYRYRMLVWMKRDGRWQIVEADNSPFTDEQTLRQIERERGAALKSKDKAWFERTYADGYTAINWRGKPLDKTGEIADNLANTDSVTSDELSEIKVHVDGDTAVVTGRLRLAGKDKNGGFDRNFIFADTFVKRDGQWRVISSQSSLTAPPATAKN